jgi:ribosomal 50S subunit-associated protein YjgA (DUF615 family)
MRFFERLDDQQNHAAGGNGGSASNDLLQQLRSEGDRLLAAGDEAIRRALAGANSEAFLRAGRQQGGE